MCMKFLSVCMHACLYMQEPIEASRGRWISRHWSTGGFKPPYGHWELNLDPLQEQHRLLTAEPFPHPAPTFEMGSHVSQHGFRLTM